MLDFSWSNLLHVWLIKTNKLIQEITALIAEINLNKIYEKADLGCYTI